MDKVWGYVIDIFMAIIIMFVAVAIYFGLRSETVMKSIYETTTEDFITDTKRNGVITIRSYEDYIEQMGIGNNLFDITFEHTHKLFEPEYRLKTIDEIIDDLNKAYGGTNDYHYREVVTEKPHVDDPINDGNLNTETNESILEKAVDTPADPNHVHTDDCYKGIKHVHDNNCRVYIPVTKTFIGSTSSNFKHCKFSDGGYTYHFVERCDNCGAYFSYTQVGCNDCGYFEWTNSGGCSCSGSHKITCGKTEGKYYDNNGNEVGPFCGQDVVSIVATNDNQTVYTNDPLITTARATYKDGSEKTIVCTTNFSTSISKQNATATLTYTYIIDGVTYKKTCEVTVTVIPRSNTCKNGHIYNMNSDGSDPGCPYCRAWIEDLRVINPTSSPIVITIGTTLQDNNIKLFATYMDGHTVEVTSGYIDNLDIHYLGTKPVTIGYKGASVTVMVKTVCATLVCDICGYEYNLYPDGTNPGCPRCISKIPVFTGNIMEYEHVNNTEEILKILYEDGKYDFNVNDTFSIRVNNKSSSLARMLLKKVYPSLSNRWFMIEKHENIMAK